MSDGIVLRYRPQARDKLVSLSAKHEVEVGGVGICSEPFLVTDVALLPQTVSSGMVQFDQEELGKALAMSPFPVWLHTHCFGGTIAPSPSSIDWTTVKGLAAYLLSVRKLARALGGPDLPVFIVMGIFNWSGMLSATLVTPLPVDVSATGLVPILETTITSQVVTEAKAEWDEEFAKNVTIYKPPPRAIVVQGAYSAGLTKAERAELRRDDPSPFPFLRNLSAKKARKIVCRHLPRLKMSMEDMNRLPEEDLLHMAAGLKKLEEMR